jgi:hypothetical protein
MPRSVRSVAAETKDRLARNRAGTLDLFNRQ